MELKYYTFNRIVKYNLEKGLYTLLNNYDKFLVELFNKSASIEIIKNCGVEFKLSSMEELKTFYNVLWLGEFGSGKICKCHLTPFSLKIYIK